MGTNYYWYPKRACSECGRDFDGVHIGKSSAGWCFSLRIHNEGWQDDADRITSLKDWKERWAREGSVIKDEYGRDVSVEDMLATIAARRWRDRGDEVPMGYASLADFYAKNYAEPGPHGLLRHRIMGDATGNRCIAHGNGTYDLIQGEFS